MVAAGSGGGGGGGWGSRFKVHACLPENEVLKKQNPEHGMIVRNTPAKVSPHK